ncbi:helix-turn-helix transcriptional regulator [Acidobacteria bacterium ACD]|nr:MAG: XRE family transcriptional regulator [Acidobacteriota bacterium]MCE7956961.1 XRE family transcriptional regulator [Acidobacteria bacterium ACB2]MDL1948396.1 helix-turn-helix transcriptional regulator [Acidobacteria bacterium ACD]
MSAVPRPAQILLVGQKIRQIRKSRHLTQSDLAGRIGVTQSDLSRMENGEYKVGLDTLFKILQVFEMSMSGFFEEPASAPAPAESEESRASEVDRRRERLVSDWASLSEDGQAEVLEFVAFKRMQETRRPRWKEEAEAADPCQRSADGEEPADA